MSQSLAQIYLHVVFSTKHRTPTIPALEIKHELHAYLGGLSNALKCPVLEVGGVTDHVHILCRFGRSIAIEVYLREMKRESSKWMKTKGAPEFAWQNGYGAFSISPSHLNPLRRYIVNQAEHHKRETFQEELLRLLKKYRIEYDEHYLWD